MIHIVFNESEVVLMKKVIELDESMAGEVLQIKDDFAAGPLAGIETEEGWTARLEWWRGLVKDAGHNEASVGSFDDRKTVEEIKTKLKENTEEEVWIWMGQNQHDVCGYYWLMSQLGNFQGRVMVLYLNNLPFINDKGQIFYPSWLHEIQPKEFIKAKKLCRPITLSEFEVDPDEWKKLCNENAMVRILEGGKKISGEQETFYDGEIMKNLTGEWQKASRLLTNTLHRMKIKTGDVFILWRMKQLINEGRIEITGDMNKGWKDVDVKGAGKTSTNNEKNIEENSAA
jgi:Domain of unknown function (DUF1835)/Protein of unknown function